MTAKTEEFSHRYTDGLLVVNVCMPSGKPAYDMTITINAAFTTCDVVFRRQFAMSDIRGLCPILVDDPEMIIHLLKQGPCSLEVDSDFNIAHMVYSFCIQMCGYDAKFKREIQFNVSGVETKAQVAAIAKSEGLSKQLAEAQVELSKARSALDLAQTELTELKKDPLCDQLLAANNELASAKAEIERLRAENDALKKTNEAFECVRISPSKRPRLADDESPAEED
jgi:hypothetical protein